MRFALFKEVPRRQRRKKRKLNDGGAARKGEDAEGSNDDSDGSGDELEIQVERMNMPPAPGAAAQAGSSPRNLAAQDPIWGDESQDVRMEVEQPPPAVAGPSDDGKIRPERFVVFYRRRGLLEFTHFAVYQTSAIQIAAGKHLCNTTTRRRTDILTPAS